MSLRKPCKIVQKQLLIIYSAFGSETKKCKIFFRKNKDGQDIAVILFSDNYLENCQFSGQKYAKIKTIFI